MGAAPSFDVLLLALLAGATIPLGAMLALIDRFHPNWLKTEGRHGVIAFGGGVLIAAVALVLVPEGVARLSAPVALLCFALGGLAFFAVDRALERSGQSVGQLLAMLVDFIPEAIALGAILLADPAAGTLLAVLIALQNLPESFNAFREISDGKQRAGRSTLIFFLTLPLLGPLAATAGSVLFAANPAALGGLMLFAAGGILYLTFEDIAPKVALKTSWLPPLGAVAGFGLGLAGEMIVGV